MLSVEPEFSKVKQIQIERFNDIILKKYGPNCGVECIDIVNEKTTKNRVRMITTLILRRTSGCKSTRKINSTSLTENRPLDIMNGYDLCDDDGWRNVLQFNILTLAVTRARK